MHCTASTKIYRKAGESERCKWAEIKSVLSRGAVLKLYTCASFSGFSQDGVNCDVLLRKWVFWFNMTDVCYMIWHTSQVHLRRQCFFNIQLWIICFHLESTICDYLCSFRGDMWVKTACSFWKEEFDILCRLILRVYQSTQAEADWYWSLLVDYVDCAVKFSCVLWIDYKNY